MTLKDFQESTIKETHIYVDATSGSDSNDGLSWATAKQTIQAGVDILPGFIRHNSSLHLKGTFTDEPVLTGKTVEPFATLIVDGGNDKVILGGPYTADISSVSSVGDSGQSWTVDEWAGYHVEVTSGPAAGELNLIHSNTATTLIPMQDWSVDPGAGATFRISRPSTSFVGTGGYVYFAIDIDGGGFLRMQNMFFDGPTTYLSSFGAVGVLACSNMIFNTSSGPAVNIGNMYNFYPDLAVRDPDTFAFDGTQTGGLSNRNGGYVAILNVNRVTFGPGFLKDVRVTGCGIWQAVDYGGRVQGLLLEGCKQTYGGGWRQRSGYAQAQCDSSPSGGTALGNGVLAKRSSLIMRDVVLTDNDSHGLEMYQSDVEFLGAISGSGNGGAGTYTHTGSSLVTKSGSTPTVTGSVGEISVSNPAAQEATWSSLSSGNVAIATEMTLVKEV